MLKGLTVVEAGEWIAAPYCGRLLADLGARVIKLETPARGDGARHYGPFPEQEADIEKSGLFAFLNTSKESVALDFSSAADRVQMNALAAKADVWITSDSRRKLMDWKLDESALRSLNPRLVFCALSPFGWTGPYRDREGGGLHAAALSGVAWATGSPGREPLQLPLAQADFQGGVNAAAAILAALLARLRTGRGQFIDIAIAEVLASYVGIGSTLYIYYGLQWRRDGRRAAGSMGPYPMSIFPCKDGLVVLIVRTPRDWDRFLKAMGSPSWADNPRYRDQVAMGRDYPDEVDPLVTELLIRYTKEELLRIAREWGFALAPVRNVSEALEDPQFAHRGFFETLELPGVGMVKLPRLPFRLSTVRPQALIPPPRLGEHTQAVLAELGTA